MDVSNQNSYGRDNKMKMFKNINQSALNYVQQAIENTAGFSENATQNLVNHIMNKQKS